MDLDLGLTRKIIEECRRQGLLRNQTAYTLATGYWESGRTMQPVREAFYISHDEAKAEAWRRVHLRYWPFYGRGLVQITWPKNYQWGARETGLPLDAQPDLALQPDVAVKLLVTGSREGQFTGKKLSDYITLQHSDFVGARRIINGTDKAAEIAAIARQYDAALKAIGYGGAVEVVEAVRPMPAPALQPAPPPPMPAPSPVAASGGWAAILAAILSLFEKK